MRFSQLYPVPTLAAAACLFGAALLTPPGSAAARARRPAPQSQPAPQAEDLGQGKALLLGGDVKGAVRFFRDAVKEREGDAEAWYYLGVALSRDGDQKDARKAFEQAARLRPDFAAAHAGVAHTFLAEGKMREAERRAEQALALDPNAAEAHYAVGVARLHRGDAARALEAAEAALGVNQDFAAAHYVKSQALLGLVSTSFRPRPGSELSKEEQKNNRLAQAARFREAAESLERFLQLSPGVADEALWREQLESLRVYGKYAEQPDGARTVYAGSDELIEKASISSKPEPGYTEEARRNGVSGVVRLRAVLDPDGTVKHVLVLRGLSHGLSEMAVRAARKIKFRPATRNGQPVSQYIVLEYNFMTY